MFLNVMPSMVICVGVVADAVPIDPYVLPSSSSVIATGPTAPDCRMIVLSGPSPTRCAYGGIVNVEAILYVPAGKNSILQLLVSS